MMVAGVDVSVLKGVSADSRKIADGYLFAALKGEAVDGRDYIDAALAAGASHVLGAADIRLPANASAHLVHSDNPRRDFALIAATFYGEQPAHIAAVTGTNGKTSVATFTAQIWEALGYKSAALGTLGLHGTGINRAGSLTTPGTAELHETLAEVKGKGIEHLAIEASSHGLAQYRMDGLKIEAAAFTNLSRDHLDYHQSMDEYLAAKARLFSEILPKGGTAVLNADVPEFSKLQDICAARDIRVLSYGTAGEGLKLLTAHPSAAGQDLELEIKGECYQLHLPLAGGFQAMNALCALGFVIANVPEKTQAALKALETLKGAPGRLQLIEGHPSGAGIYVDYAHTPDALETVLTALRPHTKGRLICLFGCGGDRDKGKRPLMGEAAVRHADVVIVSDDNPRSEEPAAIRAEIMKGAPDAIEIDGRKAAIVRAVSMLEPGDVLVVAGKGHEHGQIFKDRTEDFDDANELSIAINELNSQRQEGKQ